MNGFRALVALAALWITAAAPSGWAQNFRGRIQGLVTDQTQAVVANAQVTLLNTATGVRVVRQSSDTGLFLFDLVDAGTYTVTVEAGGFSKFVQENILVQARGDVTVNATLTPGAVQETITVAETPAAVQFNSSNKDITIDSRMASEIPRIDRNPFKLSLLAPSAVNTRGEMQPFHSWAANSVDLGGGTNLKNDLQVDGSPIGLGHKNSYSPNTDAVQEVVISTNSVDAETGHSAGGLISVTLKSGSNEWHGTGFYLGRYPWLNAEADRTRFTKNSTRQHMFGGTIGNPIIKNKLFNFFSFEDWKVGAPRSYQTTVPTPLERSGDFSRTFNPDGRVKPVYDPYSTQFNSATGAITRTPFAGNIVPQNRFDPLSGSLMKSFWDPNNAGDDITGVNNFRVGFTEDYNYYNFSNRTDYNLSDRWKFYGRVSRYHTTNINPNPTPNNSELYVPTGTLRASNQVAGEAVWMASASTVVNFRGSWHKVIDSYVSDSLGDKGWGEIWPNNNWYQSYLEASPGVPVYFPLLNIGGKSFGGGGFYWDQKPQGLDFNGKVSHQRGSHYLKAGLEHRRRFGVTFVGNTSRFFFPNEVTADTFSSPNTRNVGSEWATFLLGALDSQTQLIGGPAPDPHAEFWGMFIQDDWKVNRWLTLNLGLRNEYESAWHDPGYNFARGLDLSAPIPEMQSNQPQMPAQALALMGANAYKWNGLWNFTSQDKPGMWDPQKLALSPRLGAAIRINDLTALRIGYSRFYVPTDMMLSQAPVSGFETVSFLEPPFFGMRGYQNTLGLLEGVPQQRFSDPFPASNPLLPINGKSSGTSMGRGGSPLLWYPNDLEKAWNQRFNVNFQRQLPGEVVASVTWFMNIGKQHYTTYLNNMNPQIQVQQQTLIDTKVNNPFYNYLTPQLFPGPLRNQQTVSLSSLLKAYPHYGGLYEVGMLGADERYHSLELKAQKSFSKGWNFLFAYVYINEKTDQLFSEMDQYTNNLTYQNSNQPRHRITTAGTYELPFGRGRSILANMPKAADAVLGGWKVTGMSTFISGAILRFGKMNYNGQDPTVSEPSRSRWFNTSAFSPIASNTYVIRTNPMQFDNLRGPRYHQLDATLSKEFAITERFKTELKAAAYNALNRLNLANPNMTVTSSQFGQAIYQGSPSATFGPQTMELGSVSGRQVELGLKIIF